jgi:DNA mismatch repair protein MutS
MLLEKFKEAHKYDSVTQILQQYLDIKFTHQDCLVLFRLGDFFELFYEDARRASKSLGLTLTKKASKNNYIDMCGLPYHAVNNYIPRLLNEGYKIAICDQLESPQAAKIRSGPKAVIKRQVTRILTPGTIYEEDLLDNAPSYLMSIVAQNKSAAISYLDISTLEFNIIVVSLDNITAEIMRILPKEILLSQELLQEIQESLGSTKIHFAVQEDNYFTESKSKRSIQEYYNITSFESLGNLSNLEIRSIGSILQYIQLTHKANIPNLGFPKILCSSKFMLIDNATRQGLEIVRSSNHSAKGSLFDCIDCTKTRSGSRLLYRMLSSPLTDIEEINYRHNLIDFFRQNLKLTSNLSRIIATISDPERILSRIKSNKASAKDLLDLKNTINTINQIKQALSNEIGFILPPILEKLFDNVRPFDEICELIDLAINIDAACNLSDTGYIKASYHPRLEELGSLVDDANVEINKLRSQYVKKTGVDTLKINQNNILGIFIEVAIKHVTKINNSIFIHRQNTTNSARFTTNHLQELESKINNAKSLQNAIEAEIFLDICNSVAENYLDLVRMVEVISMCDVVTSLAKLAEEKNYIKPQITNDLSYTIKDGRHPIVEESLATKSKTFVANNLDLSSGQTWIITGPNMSGKSTFLRQNAIFAIMAQAGFFVPASYVKIGIIDKLFSRIGSSDDLNKGQSTFMVEMLETAVILSQSTPQSLVILDEVGRGTSTYDGLSIAHSCLEYICQKIGCRTLFATHYHELAELDKQFSNIKNYHAQAEEVDKKLLFLHKIKPGSADKSYGINVAKLAGLPEEVIVRAQEILDSHEKLTR